MLYENSFRNMKKNYDYVILVIKLPALNPFEHLREMLAQIPLLRNLQ